MEHPEWAAYLAAFDAYVAARASGDEEHAAQAQRLMGYFAEPLLAGHPRQSQHPMEAHRAVQALCDVLGL